MNLRTTAIYAGLAAIIAALTEIVQLAQALSTHPVHSPGQWAVSAGAGVISAAALAALPWIRAVLPTPPVPAPVAPPAAPQGPTP